MYEEAHGAVREKTQVPGARAKSKSHDCMTSIKFICRWFLESVRFNDIDCDTRRLYTCSDSVMP